MHHGSALGPLIFMTVMEALSREFRVVLSWELLLNCRWPGCDSWDWRWFE